MPIVGGKHFPYTKKGIAAAMKAKKKYANGGGPVVGDLLDTLSGLGKKGGLKTNVGGFDSSEEAVSSFAKGKSRMRDLQAQAAAARAKSGDDETPSIPADPFGSGLGSRLVKSMSAYSMSQQRKQDASDAKELKKDKRWAKRKGFDLTEFNQGDEDRENVEDLDDSTFRDDIVEMEEEDFVDPPDEIDKPKKQRKPINFDKLKGLISRFRGGYKRNVRQEPGYAKAKRSYSSYKDGGTITDPPYKKPVGPRAIVKPADPIISGIKYSEVLRNLPQIKKTTKKI